jgi:hypothetical protein
MPKMIFVNLPVRNLAASTAFYVALCLGDHVDGCGGARRDARDRVIGATSRENKWASGLVRAPVPQSASNAFPQRLCHCRGLGALTAYSRVGLA